MDASNDNPSRVRMVRILGTVHDDGRVERAEVVELVRVPVSVIDEARTPPAPWRVEEIPAGYRVLDANGKNIAYVYGEDRADMIGTGFTENLTRDQARRVAAGIARLPELLSRSRSAPPDPQG